MREVLRMAAYAATERGLCRRAPTQEGTKVGERGHGEEPVAASGDMIRRWPQAATSTALTGRPAAPDNGVLPDRNCRCGSLLDEPKRCANLAKHHIDFDEAAVFDWASCLIVPARDGRLKAIGLLKGVPVAIVFKRLGTEGISIVSMRPASRKERRLYGTR